MSNKTAYVIWTLCCVHEEDEGDEYEPGQNGEPGFLKVRASSREWYNAKVAELTASGWRLLEW